MSCKIKKDFIILPYLSLWTLFVHKIKHTKNKMYSNHITKIVVSRINVHTYIFSKINLTLSK